MDKQKILNKYSKPEDKLLISKMLDKIESCKSKNRLETTDFLDENQAHILEKILIAEDVKNYILDGGIENAERKILAFFPNKFESIVNNKNILPIKALRIELSKEMHGKYSHRDYLGGLIKLGIKREKIGDILVFKDGADILILNEISKFVLTNITSLTRFGKAKINLINLDEIRKKIINKELIEINIPSMRVDSIVSEILRTSRNKAEEVINEGRAFINHEEVLKITKQVKEGDLLTIRGKGRFEIEKIEGTTRSGRLRLIINKFV